MLAAHTHIVDSKLNIDRYCIGGGNDNRFGGARTASPSYRDLNDYLNSLKGQHPTAWRAYFIHLAQYGFQTVEDGSSRQGAGATLDRL